ncbi:hypothetical protein RDABS01_034218, partial [Bienertia sinuspersici]
SLSAILSKFRPKNRNEKRQKFDSSETNQDFISNLPTEVIEDILKRLPMTKVAQMGMLSRRWRDCWLSHRYLTFDDSFWCKHQIAGINDKHDWEKINQKINKILSHQNVPVQKFHVHLPNDRNQLVAYLSCSTWLFKLSKIGVKKMILENLHKLEDMPFLVFSCKELMKLKINHYTITYLPRDFEGFVHLRSLVLSKIVFGHGVFRRLLAKCPKLIELRIEWLIGMSHLVLDVPTVEYLTIKGDFDSIDFVNVQGLKCVSVGFFHPANFFMIDAFLRLASSSKIQIRIISTRTDFGSDHLCLEYNEFYKSNHLRRVRITGIVGRKIEFNFIEYILTSSIVLGHLLIRVEGVDILAKAKPSTGADFKSITRAQI